MKPILLVLWLSYSCPGGPLKGLIPASLRPLVCAPAIEYRMAESPGEVAEALVDLGPAGTVLVLKVTEREAEKVKVEWNPVVNTE